MGVRGDMGNGEGRGDGCFIIYIGCRKRCSDPAVMLVRRDKGGIMGEYLGCGSGGVVGG
jgi:hypothetical protein